MKWWVDVHDDWTKHIDKIRRDVGDRKAERDVKRAEHRAEHREDDAEAAVAFAYAASEEAEYAVLDAILARQEADELVEQVELQCPQALARFRNRSKCLLGRHRREPRIAAGVGVALSDSARKPAAAVDHKSLAGDEASGL